MCSTAVRSVKANPFCQVKYVSLSTNVFTGMHSLFLLAAPLWFIYQLKYDTVACTFVRKLPQECKFLVMMAFFPVSLSILLRRKTKKSFHLQRNIYWYVFYTDDLSERRSIAIGHSDSIRACSG